VLLLSLFVLNVVLSFVLEQIELTDNRFGFEPEFTVKVAPLKCPICEKRISYNPRTKADGKKISWRDGLRAIYVILKYGLFRAGT